MMPDPRRSPVTRSSPLHHIELWVPDLTRAQESWGWLLTRLGAQPFQTWGHGRSWRWGADGTYVVLEQSPAMTGDRHERRAPRLNHLASWVGAPEDLHTLTEEAPAHGRTLM